MARILLVEPDVVLAKTYCQALENAGHQTAWASSAQAALDAADTQTPDIVVLELQLTGHSGIEFLYEFRSYSEWQNVPVLVHSLVPLTAFTDTKVLKDELGVKEYYYKPNTRLVQLLSGVREYLAVA
ncbi:MAG TPA: response regulator [Candidatus Saccharimonadales bacterium]|nr:response regulator [Candidatus Saccharimonadales bacterium]